jgi:DNA-binding response OmpR family regulator
MKVMIVEKNDLLAEVFVTALAEEGIQSEVIVNDDAAIAACKQDEPQVVITGINRAQEDMRGWRMARKMRRRCPRVAVLFMAALWPARMRALGCRERFLLKPVALEKFVKTVQELLPS